MDVTFSHDRRTILLRPEFGEAPRYQRDLQDLGARWLKSSRCWSIANIKANRLHLEKLFPEIAELEAASPRPVREDIIRNLNPFLTDYQVRGIDRLISSELPGMLLNFSPGLGKTVTALVAAQMLEAQRVLIITPRTLTSTWIDQAQKWLGIKLWDLYAKSARSGWSVTTYETLWNTTQRRTYEDIPWDIIICDESSRLIRAGTKTSKSVEKLTQSTKRLWLLSGTPIRKYVDDLWNQFRLIFPQAFKSYWRFAEQYCYIDSSLWGPVVVGSRDLDFRETFSDIMIVENSSEVLDLPEARIEVLKIPLGREQSEAYSSMQELFIAELDSHKVEAKNRMSQIVRLLEISSSLSNVDLGLESSKHDAIVEMLSEKSVQFPLLIWAYWRQGAAQLSQRLSKLGFQNELVLGGHHDPAGAVERFKEGDFPILIMSPGVGKFGLTMTNINTMIYLDKTFDMEAYVQTMYRFRRLGLDHSVRVISLVAEGTVDELVADNLAGKSIDLNRISNEDLSILLTSLGRSQS